MKKVIIIISGILLILAFYGGGLDFDKHLPFLLTVVGLMILGSLIPPHIREYIDQNMPIPPRKRIIKVAIITLLLGVLTLVFLLFLIAAD